MKESLKEVMDEIKADFIKVSIFFAIFVIIGVIWQLIDILQFGKIQPSIADTIFGAALAYAIYRSLHIKVITDRIIVPGKE